MENKLDLIVLGATGFTGQYVVKNLVTMCKDPAYSDLTWGISGRNKEKISNLLQKVKEWGGEPSKVPVHMCDITDAVSLKGAARRARVLLNLTGPNTVYSEIIIRACIEARTHYVDITAEWNNMLDVFERCSAAAREANVLIVLASGFSAMTTFAGLIHLENQFKGTLRSVEGYIELGVPKKAYIPYYGGALVHYGTWECMIHVLRNFKQAREHKKKIFPSIEPVPDDMKKCMFHRKDGKFWFPYPGPDQDLVEVTQTYMRDEKRKTPYHFKAYTTTPLFIHLILLTPLLFLLYFLCQFKFFFNLFLKHPKLFSLGYFSHKGPSEEMSNSLAYTFKFNGRGWADGTDVNSPPNKTMSVQVSGNDPGYQTTAISIIAAGISLLRDHSKLPKGGVLTDGSAFQDIEIVDRLRSMGMKIEVTDGDAVEVVNK